MIRAYLVAYCQYVGEIMIPVLEWAIGCFVNAWEWIRDHIVDLLFFALMILLAFSAVRFWLGFEQAQQQQIDLCVRAFDYTRDQCEFIVKNRVMPR